MFWDDLVRRWRRDARGVDRRLLRATAGHVAVLPAPRRRRRSRAPWLVLIVLLVGVVILLLVQGGQAQSPPVTTLLPSW
jgi:hypothetical protein